MPKKFAVFDIDGTLIRWQLYHAMADTLAKRGLINSQDYAAMRTARMAWKRRVDDDSFKTYEREVVAAYEKVLSQMTVADFQSAVNEVIDEYKDQVYSYTRDLIQQLKTSGYLLFAISGSQIELVSKIAEHYGFDDYIGSTYEQVDGKFTGQSTVHLGAKHLVLDQLVQKQQATYKGSIAVGDSESDISMLEAVENPIAFNPTKKLFAHAKDKNWKIVIERKNMIYQLVKEGDNYSLKDN